MRFKVGTRVLVKNVYSGGNFDNGDIVIIKQVGNEDEDDCYGAISPHDGLVWFLYEDEVDDVPSTNADRIRAVNDEDLAKLLCCTGWKMSEYQECLNWLQQPAEEANT